MHRFQKLLNLAVFGTRLFLGLTFFTTGMAKLTYGNFPGYIGPIWLEQTLAPYGLGMWVRFLAWSQVTVGLLLLSQRFATIGAIMLFPLIANILMVTISLGWQGTPFVNGFLLLLNVFLLAADYQKLKFLFFDDMGEIRQMPVKRTFRQVDRLWLAGLLICLASPLLLSLHRFAPLSLAMFGILIFIICGVWHLRLKRSPAEAESQFTNLRD